MLRFDPSLQELQRRSVAECRVLPLFVVEGLDVFKGRSLDLGMRCVPNAMHSFILETVSINGRRPP